jgi:DNA-binding LacI/PurR family transcriptional regulator
MTTIKDIAKKVGVSVTTVSRALNGYSDVNQNTRNKIIEAAKELNYTPNAVARTLVTKKSKTIGLIVSELNRSSSKDNFTFEVLCGINAYTAEADYDMVLFSTDPKKQKNKSYSQLCMERGVDGAILQGIRTDDPYLIEVLESDIPCVLIDIPIQTQSVGYVTTDNSFGAKNAVEHLIELGHRHIGMVNGHEQAFVSKERLKGYKAALLENGLELDETMVVNGQFFESSAEEVTYKLLIEHPQITALFCSSDLMAFGAIKAAQRLNLSVPRDLSVVGYDDIILASYVRPRLTTVAQDKYLMGYKAAEMLISMLNEDKKGHTCVLPTELKKRDTTTTVRPRV